LGTLLPSLWRFCGVGSACIAAAKTGRHFVGYETNQEYIDAALERISEFAGTARAQKKNMTL
jgi:DNA modification methylase